MLSTLVFVTTFQRNVNRHNKKHCNSSENTNYIINLIYLM